MEKKILGLLILITISNNTWSSIPQALVSAQNNQKENCSICLDPFTPDSEEVRINCGCKNNFFHRNCIIEWLRVQQQHHEARSCPLCRQKATSLTPIIPPIDEVYTPLIQSVMSNDPEETQRLINTGYDLNLQTRYGNTALMLAANFKNITTTRMLINASADLNVQNRDLNTALIIAIYANSTEIVQMLINAGADLNISNRNHNTALMEAAFLKNLGIVRILIRAKAHVNLQNDQGNTALTLAIIAGNNTEVIQELLTAHANIAIKNNNYEDALDVAIKLNNQEIRTLIQARMRQQKNQSLFNLIRNAWSNW